MSDRLTDETESRKKMADKLSHERHQNQKEKEATQEVRQAVNVQNKQKPRGTGGGVGQHQCHRSDVSILSKIECLYPKPPFFKTLLTEVSCVFFLCLSLLKTCANSWSTYSCTSLRPRQKEAARPAQAYRNIRPAPGKPSWSRR